MDVLDEIDKRIKSQPLVNESVIDPLDAIDAKILGEENARKGIKSSDQLQVEKQAMERKALMPKTWFGEVKQGVARGVDQLQELGYGLGVLGAEAADLPKIRDWFVKGVEEQRREIESQPATVPTYEGVDNFDSLMRYALSGAGEFVPQVAESFAAGAAGAAIGGTAAPGPGTVVGGIAGFVEKQAIKNIIKSGVEKYVGKEGSKAVKNEMLAVARGQIAKNEVQDVTKTLLVNETKNLMSKYGAWAGVGTSSWAMETGSIYNDLKENPNLEESDRRASAIVGGLVAAIPDTVLGGYIASKFFPGVKSVPTKELKDANNYLVKFAKNFATQIPKYATLEGGQEYAQTIVEEAAKNYADPERRDEIFTFTPEQKVSFLDAAFKGAIGGGMMGVGAGAIRTVHSNPKVRERERVIIQKMGSIDSSILDGEETPEDQRLSSIAKRRSEIEELVASQTLKPEEFDRLTAEASALDAEESTLLGEEDVVETPKPKETSPVRAMSPIERAVSNLRSLYPDQTRTAKETAAQSDPEQLQRVEAEIQTLVNESLDGDEQQNRAYGQALQTAIAQDVRNFLASEGIEIRIATPQEIKSKMGGGETFAAMETGPGGKFALIVPNAKTFFENAEAYATADSETPKATTDYLHNVGKIIGHEVIHLADLIQIKAQWQKESPETSFSKYEEKEMIARGVALRRAQKNLPFISKAVYQFGGEGGLSNRALGQEFTRMLVEYARTGKLTEVTESLAKAEREAQDSESKGAISNFLSKWIDAIQKIHASLVRFIDPKKSPPEVVMAFDQINKVLDKYGVLVNEKKETKEEAKPEVKKEESKSEEPEKPGLTVQNAIDTNAKVEFQGQRGRLSVDTDNALILKTSKQDILVQDVANPEMPLSVLNVRATRPGKVEEALQALRDATPSDAQEAIAEIIPENEPNFYRDASSHPLLNGIDAVIEIAESKTPRARKTIKQTPEYRREVDAITGEMLDRSENIIISTIERVEGMDATPERKQQLIEPFEDLWQGIEELRNFKEVIQSQRDEARLKKIEQDEKESNRELPAESSSAPSEPTATPEVPKATESKRRRTRTEVAYDKLAKAIKAKQLTKAMEAYLEYRALDGLPATARDFKEMHGKGATLKAFNEYLSLTRKPAAKAATTRMGPIKSAAFKAPDGTIFEAAWHGPAFDAAKATGRWTTAELVTQGVEGFTDRDGNFLTRREAYDISKSAGLPVDDFRNELHAVNLFDAIEKLQESSSPESIASNLELVFDGIFMDRLWQWTDRNVQPIGATFTTPIGATQEEVSAAHQAKLTEAASEEVNLDDLLGGLGFPAAKAAVPRGIPKREQPQVNRMMRDSANTAMHLAGNMKRTSSQELPVQGDVLYEGADLRELEYSTRPRWRGYNEAVAVISEKGGAMKVAEGLLSDPLGKFLELTEDEVSTVGPNPKLGWVYDDVARQLYGVASKLERGDGSRASISYIRSLANQMKDQIMLTRNTAGALIDSSGKVAENMDGAATLEQLRSQIIPHADKAIGEGSRKNIEALVSELNETLVNEMPNAVKSPKFISAVRRLMKLVTTTKWKKGYRQTIINNVKILEDITRKAAARMAQYTGMDRDSNAYTEEYITRLVKEMSGVPKGSSSKEELQVVREALGKVVREVGKSMGFITDQAKADKMSMQEKMAMVLKNEILYSEFAALLKNSYIKEYGGNNPSPDFMAEAEIVYARVLNRMYDTESLNVLVNEKLREYDTGNGKGLSISDIAKKGYADGEANIEMIRRDLRDFMSQQGVENAGLVDILLEDMTDAMEKKVDAAREKFLGSTASVKEALKFFGTNLAEAVTDYSVNPDKMRESFEDYLVRRYGFPNTTELPMASYFAKVMMQSLSPLVERQNARLLQQWLDRAEREVENSKKTTLEKDNSKRKLKVMVDRVLALSKAGVMEQEDIYNVLQPLFDLPKWNPEVAQSIMELGDKMELAKSPRQKDIIKNELADLLAQHKPLQTSDAYTSWMYFSMLSGPGTPAVNLAGNFLGMMSYLATETAKRPQRLPQMLRAMIRAAIGSGYAEMRESWFWGTSLGKDGNKYFKGKNVAEMEDPFFEGRFSKRLGLQKADEALARFTHRLLRGVPYLRPKYVGRMLTATDMWFYKMAQEMAFAARSNTVGTPQMWESALVKARQEMLEQGMNPDESKANRARRDVLANSIYENLRIEQGDQSLVNENTIAWSESHQEALEATFQQEPTGLLGSISRAIERVTEDHPAAKLLVPFTRVAANITNFMLDWTPVGTARYLISNITDKTNPFKLMEDGKYNAHIDHLTRSILGVASTFVLMLMAGREADEDDPDFMIYGDGPKDLDLKRMMMNRGWKANSIKIGGTYYSYIYWPNAMALSIIGRQFDNYREGRIASPYDFSMATTAVALVEAVKNQSFLVSIADLFGAIDSANPERNLSRLGARIATIPVPNLLKQSDKFLDPTLQQSESFFEYVVKEMPVFRWGLEPALNYFGEPIERTRGVVALPGFDRFATFEKTDDPVLNLISERNFKLPGYSKSTRLNGEAMGERYGEYIKIAGPRIYKRIQASINTLREMPRQDAQDMLESIATEEKKKARLELEQKYPSTSR